MFFVCKKSCRLCLGYGLIFYCQPAICGLVSNPHIAFMMTFDTNMWISVEGHRQHNCWLHRFIVSHIISFDLVLAQNTI